jgi:hypothetical protein
MLKADDSQKKHPEDSENQLLVQDFGYEFGDRANIG